jgi:hypothetical protein
MKSTRRVPIGDAQLALLQLLEQHADDVADGAYLAGLAMLEEAADRARQALDYRWRSSPRTELSALRRRLQLATTLVRFAVRVREYDDERYEQKIRENEMLADLERQLKRRRRRST